MNTAGGKINGTKVVAEKRKSEFQLQELKLLTGQVKIWYPVSSNWMTNKSVDTYFANKRWMNSNWENESKGEDMGVDRKQ